MISVANITWPLSMFGHCKETAGGLNVPQFLTNRADVIMFVLKTGPEGSQKYSVQWGGGGGLPYMFVF